MGLPAFPDVVPSLAGRHLGPLTEGSPHAGLPGSMGVPTGYRGPWRPVGLRSPDSGSSSLENMPPARRPSIGATHHTRSYCAPLISLDAKPAGRVAMTVNGHRHREKGLTPRRLRHVLGPSFSHLRLRPDFILPDTDPDRGGQMPDTPGSESYCPTTGNST